MGNCKICGGEIGLAYYDEHKYPTECIPFLKAQLAQAHADLLEADEVGRQLGDALVLAVGFISEERWTDSEYSGAIDQINQAYTLLSVKARRRPEKEEESSE